MFQLKEPAGSKKAKSFTDVNGPLEPYNVKAPNVWQMSGNSCPCIQSREQRQVLHRPYATVRRGSLRSHGRKSLWTVSKTRSDYQPETELKSNYNIKTSIKTILLSALNSLFLAWRQGGKAVFTPGHNDCYRHQVRENFRKETNPLGSPVEIKRTDRSICVRTFLYTPGAFNKGVVHLRQPHTSVLLTLLN